jgi:hypothetical protein
MEIDHCQKSRENYAAYVKEHGHPPPSRGLTAYNGQYLHLAGSAVTWKPADKVSENEKP